ncbi:MAG: DUF4058 family protein [Planctomycetes bacterium]|nr:DUF4058 family protein [Planctomycetota bacterium]
MPLLDHFHPPLSERRHWQAFHSRWASAISDWLNEQGLPDHLFAEPTIDIAGQVQVDVATLEERDASATNGASATATLPAVKSAPAPTWVMPAVFPASFEVRVINTEGGPKLVAAIELVSPSNKDRPSERRVFAIKCASYLAQEIPVIIMDVVTSRLANLHNEIMDLLEVPGCRMPAKTSLYAVAYRPVRREAREEIDVWPATFAIGDALPSLPLYVASDMPVIVDFHAAYLQTCRMLRITVSEPEA